FWEQRRLRPPKVDIVSIVKDRARRYLWCLPPAVDGSVRRAGSRDEGAIPAGHRYRWGITSPPYYGMQTCLPKKGGRMRDWGMERRAVWGRPPVLPSCPPFHRSVSCTPLPPATATAGTPRTATRSRATAPTTCPSTPPRRPPTAAPPLQSPARSPASHGPKG